MLFNQTTLGGLCATTSTITPSGSQSKRGTSHSSSMFLCSPKLMKIPRCSSWSLSWRLSQLLASVLCQCVSIMYILLRALCSFVGEGGREGSVVAL